MIKNYYVLLIVIHFLCIPIFLISMDDQNFSYIQAVVLFDSNIAAIATKNSCFLIKNPTKPGREQTAEILFKGQVHNIIPDKKRKRLGIFCNDFFHVYDINEKKTLWSQKIYSTNYSAAFSAVDDAVFLYDDGELKSNDKISMKLPYVGSSTYIGIECHPTKKELVYPCSNRALSICSFAKTITVKRYYPQITEKNSILRAFYSPQGDDIALLTNQHEIFIYNPKNNSTTSIQKLNGSPHKNCKNLIFVPKSEIIAFSPVNCIKMYFWDFKKKEFIKSDILNFDYSLAHANPFIKNTDFSDDGECYLSIKRSRGMIQQTSPLVMKYRIHQTYFPYFCILKSLKSEYPLPLDIIRLLIQQLRFLYEL